MIGSTNRASSWLNFAQRSRDEGGLGLAPHQAAGLVGNLVNESGQDLNPWGPTGDNGTAWGTAQWRGDRLARLKARPDYQTLEGQQAFMREELDGPENKAYRALQGAGTPEDAASAVNHLYERSADTSGNRERAARQLMTQFGGDSGPGALTSSYASTESKPSMPTPALSADNAMGPGILNLSGAGGGDDDRVARALIGIGSSLSGITNPDQARVLAAQQAALAKQPGNKWSVAHVDPKTGQALLTNGSTFVPWKAFAPKPDDSEYDKAADIASAKSNTDLGDQINQAARDSSGTAATVADARAALSDPNLKQGIDGPARQMLNKAYTAFGFGDPATAANGDVASALSNKLALQMVNAGGTKLLPGSFSDSDRKFVTQMSTSLSNSPEANQRLLDIYERANNNVQEAEALRAKHVNENDGRIRPSFRQELADLSTRQLKAAQDEAAARTSAMQPTQPNQPTGNVFTTKSGKKINWSF